MPGFLAFSRASFMMDVVAIALLAVLPILAFSIWLVMKRHQYLWHKRLQLGTSIVLAIAITLFELDVRLNDWRPQAALSPFYDSWLFPLLYGHLVVAVTTTILWAFTLVRALKSFPLPPRPSKHSKQHRLLGRLAAVGMYLTAISGWLFYWAAFVANTE